MEIRDGATLMLLNTLKPSNYSHTLKFSPDSRLLTQIGKKNRTLTTWDLQTGGSVDTTFPEDVGWDLSFTYFMDKKMLAVTYTKDLGQDFFVGTHDLSAARTHLYQVPEGRVIPPIWAHGEFLRFATVEPGSITIWEAEFTLTHPPKLVESFPDPREIPHRTVTSEILFLPSPSRLAIADYPRVSVRDLRGSKPLLNARISAKQLSFSSDGHLFAYYHTGDTGEVHVWKESPAGYVFHQKLAVVSSSPVDLCLSPNGKSILISPYSKIHLRHTKDPILPDHGFRKVDTRSFTLAFSPDKLLAAFAREGGDKVTVLDLRSGDSQLTADTHMEVRGLGVTESAVAVVSEYSVCTWSLTAADTEEDYRTHHHHHNEEEEEEDEEDDWAHHHHHHEEEEEGTREDGEDAGDIVQIPTFDRSPPSRFSHWSYFRSISSDLSRIVTSGCDEGLSYAGLEIYDASTKRCLAGVTTNDTGVLKSQSLQLLNSKSLI